MREQKTKLSKEYWNKESKEAWEKWDGKLENFSECGIIIMRKGTHNRLEDVASKMVDQITKENSVNRKKVSEESPSK